MKVLRTPEDRFHNLPDYPFAPHFARVEDLRIHYVDEGDDRADPVLMLHGEPSWSFLYRKMIPLFVQAGYRAIAPDLIGFGKSDKPAALEDYSYRRHLTWISEWFTWMDLQRITLVCQDWGSLLGLRLVAQQPERFARVVVCNGGLPTGDQQMPDAFVAWQEFSQKVSRLPVGRIIQGATISKLPPEVVAAYEAPFPDESYKAGARIFPALVPTSPDDPEAGPNRRAWRKLMRFDKPFLTAFSDSDPITRGADAAFQRLVPGAKGQPHTIIENAGHFLQEDQGERLAEVVLNFMVHSGE